VSPCLCLSAPARLVCTTTPQMDKAYENSIACTDAWKALQEHVADIEKT
jgi:hypothetical protein